MALPGLVSCADFRQMRLRVRGVAALHKVAAESHRTEHQQPATGAELPGLHGDIVQKAAMLAVPHHVVAENSVQ
jgi:hypothetical protein